MAEEEEEEEEGGGVRGGRTVTGRTMGKNDGRGPRSVFQSGSINGANAGD